MIKLLIFLLCSSAAGDVVTAYCPCAACCGRAGGLTTMGTVPRRRITVAGPAVVPLGTRVYIEGVGVRIVEDRTAKKFDGRWDIFTDSHARARAFGKQNRRVVILVR